MSTPVGTPRRHAGDRARGRRQARGRNTIFARHEPIDYGARASVYRREGWERFDPNADPYRPSQAEIDRIRARYLGAEM